MKCNTGTFKKIPSPHSSFTISTCQGQQCGNPNQDDLHSHIVDPDLMLQCHVTQWGSLQPPPPLYPTVTIMSDGIRFFSFKFFLKISLLCILLLNINLFLQFPFMGIVLIHPGFFRGASQCLSQQMPNSCIWGPAIATFSNLQTVINSYTMAHHTIFIMAGSLILF